MCLAQNPRSSLFLFLATQKQGNGQAANGKLQEGIPPSIHHSSSITSFA